VAIKWEFTASELLLPARSAVMEKFRLHGGLAATEKYKKTGPLASRYEASSRQKLAAETSLRGQKRPEVASGLRLPLRRVALLDQL